MEHTNICAPVQECIASTATPHTINDLPATYDRILITKAMKVVALMHSLKMGYITSEPITDTTIPPHAISASQVYKRWFLFMDLDYLGCEFTEKECDEILGIMHHCGILRRYPRDNATYYSMF